MTHQVDFAEVVLIGFLVIIIGSSIVGFIAIAKGYRRAIRGLKMIENANITSEKKMVLLLHWREPSVSRASYDWLQNTIRDLEKKNAI